MVGSIFLCSLVS